MEKGFLSKVYEKSGLGDGDEYLKETRGGVRVTATSLFVRPAGLGVLGSTKKSGPLQGRRYLSFVLR